jgi:hypothetical protein
MQNMKLVKARTAARILVLLLSCGVGMLATPSAHADEGGTSFWLPGQFGSLNAAPGDTGWSLPLIYFHASMDAGGSVVLEKRGQVSY